MAEKTTPTTHSSTASELCCALLEVVRARGYLRADEPFQLAAGGLSYDYVDMRRAVSSGPDLRLAAEAVLGTLAEEQLAFDAIGGLTMGADPVSHATALLSGKDWFSVRKAEKDHGVRQRIEGTQLDGTRRVVVFEDTVSTGRSILDALDAVQATGARVVAAVTILDRGEVAAAAFAQRDVPYLALLSYADLGIDPIASAAGTASDPTS